MYTLFSKDDRVAGDLLFGGSRRGVRGNGQKVIGVDMLDRMVSHALEQGFRFFHLRFVFWGTVPHLNQHHGLVLFDGLFGTLQHSVLESFDVDLHKRHAFELK